MRVRLANWHGRIAPGSVVEVPDDEVPGMRRDGRIAEVLPEEQHAPAVAVPAPPVETPEPPLTEGLPAAEPEQGRARRRGKSSE
jgi:hypothetical protein